MFEHFCYVPKCSKVPNVTAKGINSTSTLLIRSSNVIILFPERISDTVVANFVLSLQTDHRAYESLLFYTAISNSLAAC